MSSIFLAGHTSVYNEQRRKKITEFVFTYNNCAILNYTHVVYKYVFSPDSCRLEVSNTPALNLYREKDYHCICVQTVLGVWNIHIQIIQFTV